MMRVQSVQFRRTVGLFNNQKFLKHNMNQSFSSDITMRQYHTTTLRTFRLFTLVMFLLALVLRFISPPRQFRIQILKLAFLIRFLFIYIFYGSIYNWLYIPVIDLSGDIEKNPVTRPSSSQNISICHWNLKSITVHFYVKFRF